MAIIFEFRNCLVIELLFILVINDPLTISTIEYRSFANATSVSARAIIRLTSTITCSLFSFFCFYCIYLPNVTLIHLHYFFIPFQLPLHINILTINHEERSIALLLPIKHVAKEFNHQFTLYNRHVHTYTIFLFLTDN